MCLTVKTVVDSVNNVVGRGRGGSEAALILLDQILFWSSKSGDAVHFRDTFVWAVAGNLSRNRRVKTRHLQVHTDIGVVDIDNARSTQVTNIFVITDGVGGGGKGGEPCNDGCLRQKVAAFGGNRRGRSLNVVAWHKGGNGAAR